MHTFDFLGRHYTVLECNICFHQSELKQDCSGSGT